MTNLPLAGASYTAKKLLPVVQKAAVERIDKGLSSTKEFNRNDEEKLDF